MRRQHSVSLMSLRIFPSLRFSPMKTNFCRDANSVLLRAHFGTSSIDRLYAQNPAGVRNCSLGEREGPFYSHVVVRNSIGSMVVFVQLVGRHKIFNLHKGLYSSISDYLRAVVYKLY